jgi:uncharacterized protein (DUF1330 family)
VKEYVPKAEAIIKEAGGRYVASGGAGSSGKHVRFEGELPKSRVVILIWDSLEKIRAAVDALPQ